jgi:hypothetical protein
MHASSPRHVLIGGEEIGENARTHQERDLRSISKNRFWDQSLGSGINLMSPIKTYHGTRVRLTRLIQHAPTWSGQHLLGYPALANQTSSSVKAKVQEDAAQQTLPVPLSVINSTKQLKQCTQTKILRKLPASLPVAVGNAPFPHSTTGGPSFEKQPLVISSQLDAATDADLYRYSSRSKTANAEVTCAQRCTHQHRLPLLLLLFKHLLI